MNAATPDTAPSAEALFCCALLQALTEVCIELKVDPDGSLTPRRVLSALGQYEQLSRVGQPEGTPWDPGAAEARLELRTSLKRLEPIIARLARAATKDR